MRPINVKSVLIGTVTILIAAFLIIPMSIQDVKAEEEIISVPPSTIVIAPSTIVISNAEHLRKGRNKEDDNTVKAIFNFGEYPLANNCIVMLNSDTENNPVDFSVENSGAFVEPDSVRYVYDEDMLFFEFDRNATEDYLSTYLSSDSGSSSAILPVVVAGTFYVKCGANEQQLYSVSGKSDIEVSIKRDGVSQ